VTAAAMPPQIILANESVTVTFNPEGEMLGNVYPNSYDFGDVTMNSNEESIAFTLCNNGTVQMDTNVETNVTTANMECNGTSGLPLAEDFFALQFTNSSAFDGNNLYISNTSASKTELDTALPGLTSGTFYITIWIENTAINYGQQSTWVNFTFTAT
jgi:hypothetical protein